MVSKCSRLRGTMKLLVVLVLVALASADTIWEKFRGDRTGGNGWNGGRLMGDMGMDDDNRFTKHRGNYFDSREVYEGGGGVGDNRLGGHTNRFDNLGDLGKIGVGIHGFQDRIRTVDNVDKKFVKHDDDLKLRILGDNLLLVKQKFIMDVLLDVHRDIDNENVNRGTYHFVEGETNYKNFDKVIDFFRLLRNRDAVLPRGRVFVINHKVHRRQTMLLFNLFVYSKDFNVFQKNVLWARHFINEEMFVHALIAAILHRDDLIGVKVPALYEILPYKFHTSMTINKALRIGRRDNVINKDDLIILNKYTKDYMTANDEGKLAYLMEDIGWNLYHYFFHIDFASWIGGKDFNLNRERRGEKYLYFIQQLLARYNLERFSNGLGNIKDITVRDTIRTGYNPMMVNRNGLPVSMRKNYYDVRSTGDYYLINRVIDWGRRIRDAIDKGYCHTIDGGRVDLKRSDAVDILGNLIQSNIDSVNTRYYGSIVRDFSKLLNGGYVKNTDEFKLVPGVVSHHETALRDPVTYQLYKLITKLYYQFKDLLPTYKKTDLVLDGVRVDDVRTTKMMTYFDVFDVDITTITDFNRMDVKDVHIRDDRTNVNDKTVIARHVRLNHKPFSVKIDLTVDRAEKVVIRTFLGPKFDYDGKLWQLKYNRENFVELDKFTRDLTVGKVTIERNSRDFIYVVKDRTTVMDIYKQVLFNNDVNRLIDMHVDEANCGFPDRLVLPKGWVGGMPMQLFVIINKAKDIVKRDFLHTTVCGKRTLLNEVDDNALGYPFDRRIDESEFYTHNMLFKDVFIFHNDDLMKMQMVRTGDFGVGGGFNRFDGNRNFDQFNTLDGFDSVDGVKMMNGVKVLDSREKLQ